MDPSVAVELEVLKRRYEALAARTHRVEDWIDTVSSPWWKRVGFVLKGWRWKRLGRWYRQTSPPWPPRPGDRT